MSSNSIRVSNQLFQDAQTVGDYVARSAAQQVEYWARIGQALEASGATAQALLALLRGRGEAGSAVATEDELRTFKRQQQARDIAALESGQADVTDMMWFNEERVQQAKLLDSPY